MRNVYDQICRLCLHLSSDLLPIFNEESNICAAIMSCTVIELSRKDGYPENICQSCMVRLNEAFIFKQQCENSDALLRQSGHELLKGIDIVETTEIDIKVNDNSNGSISEKEQLSEQDDEQIAADYKIQDQSENDAIFSQIEYLKSEDEHSRGSNSQTYIIKVSPEDTTLTNNSVEKDYCSSSHIIKDGPYKEDISNDIQNSNRTKKEDIIKTPQDINTDYSDEHKLSCSFCSDSFTSEEELEKHKMTHKGPYHCLICNQEFTLLQHFYDHKRVHKKPQYKCETCGKIYTRRYRLADHITAVHRGLQKDRVECDICFKTFSTKGNLTKHKRIHNDGEPHECHICGKTFKQSTSLQCHMDVHRSPGNPHRCRLCEYSAQHRFTLMRHMRLNHAPNPPVKQPIKCEICDKILSSKITMRHHMKIHKNIREYLCGHCGKGFVFKSGLISHERTHTGEKPFKCKECGKSFRQKMGLHVHRRVHTGEKPYHCEVCDKSFSQYSHLRSHLFMHSGEKRYACSLCQRKFALSEGLRYHMMTHTGETPFKCSLCNRGFHIPYKLKVHMSKSHNMVMEKPKCTDDSKEKSSMFLKIETQ